MLCDSVWSARDAGEGDESIGIFAFKNRSSGQSKLALMKRAGLFNAVASIQSTSLRNRSGDSGPLN